MFALYLLVGSLMVDRESGILMPLNRSKRFHLHLSIECKQEGCSDMGQHQYFEVIAAVSNEKCGCALKERLHAVFTRADDRSANVIWSSFAAFDEKSTF